MKKLQIQKAETTYRIDLGVSSYDFLEVVQALDKRITIKFLETRWRTVEDTIELLEEIIGQLKTLD